MRLQDTIAALSTPPGRGGIGVIRLSGPDAVSIASRILQLPPGAEWTPWRAHLAALHDDAGNTIDEVVATFFAAPRSYTSEDVVEISCHGAPVILRHALERACVHGASGRARRIHPARLSERPHRSAPGRGRA
ncbi:MAG: hypothetical protein R2762_07150 [Bryobacteraceae bacterium]